MAQDPTNLLKQYSEETKRHFDVVSEHLIGKIEAAAEQVASNSEKITSVQETLDVMKDDIAIIKNGLKQKVDRDEFVTLEKRVALLEARRR